MAKSPEGHHGRHVGVKPSCGPSEVRRLTSRLAGLKTSLVDREEKARRTRDGFRRKYERAIDPDGSMPPEQRGAAVEAAVRDHFRGLAAVAHAGRSLRRIGP